MTGQYEVALLAGIGLIFLSISFLILIVKVLVKPKSYTYRKYLTNLYVAGRIRQMSEKSKVDLNEEELKFLKYEKLSKEDRMRDLDDQIEIDLMNEMGESSEEKKGK